MVTLLGSLIKKMEQTNLQHEKLAVLRKMAKQKEKKIIVSERIEIENHKAGDTLMQSGGGVKNSIAFA